MALEVLLALHTPLFHAWHSRNRPHLRWKLSPNLTDEETPMLKHTRGVNDQQKFTNENLFLC